MNIFEVHINRKNGFNEETIWDFTCQTEPHQLMVVGLVLMEGLYGPMLD